MSDAVAKLFDMEAKIRELATEAQLGNYRKAEELYSSASPDLYRLADETYNEVRNTPFADEVYDIISTSYTLLEQAGAGITEENPNSRVALPSVRENLDKLDKMVYNLTGEHCAYKVSDTVASIANDVASCLHRTAEFLSSVMSARPVSGACFAVKRDADGEKLCKLWDMLTEEDENRRDYILEDRRAQVGWVVGKKVYLRVGSSKGHRTYIDLDKGIVQYYDDDILVNKAVKKLMEDDAKLSCEYMPNNEGVTCRGDVKDRMAEVASVLSRVTSMDVRFDRGLRFSKGKVYDEAFQRFIKNKKDVLSDP